MDLHLSSAMHKLNTRNRVDAAARVRDHGWI
jgi:DNA-binding NarL/FixJ family response regulator